MYVELKSTLYNTYIMFCTNFILYIIEINTCIIRQLITRVYILYYMDMLYGITVLRHMVFMVNNGEI